MASYTNAQASVGFLSMCDDLFTRLFLDYSVFYQERQEDDEDARRTGKINKFTRQTRLAGAEQEVDDARTLTRKVCTAV
ncbi:hypothetical protein JCM8097_007050 [Rhodosporidiobolus ruineniae]